MSLIFISGVSGTGKTTLLRELLKRGMMAYDADTECVRLSKTSDKIVDYETARRDGYRWMYPEDALHSLKQKSLRKDVFLLGITDNMQEIQAAADEFIWMEIPLDVLNDRLDRREKEYGKSESERKIIFDKCVEMNGRLTPETFTLDATKTVAEIADDLMDHISLR